MKILVTGGTGYLGTHIRRHFDADDLSRASGLDMLVPNDAQIVEEFDVVIHLAAMLDKSPDADEDVFEANVEGTVNILKNVRRDAVFIFASTKDVYGRFADNFEEVPETCSTQFSGHSALEWSKLIAERYVEYYAGRNGFRSCIFRISTPYAPLSKGTEPNFVGHFADAVNKGEPIILAGNGRPIRDLLHVDDISTACEAFIGSAIRHGLYNLGGGRSNALSLNGIVAKMEEVSGLQAVVERDEAGPFPVPKNYISDISLALQELGWKPKISNEKGFATLF